MNTLSVPLRSRSFSDLAQLPAVLAVQRHPYPSVIPREQFQGRPSNELLYDYSERKV